MSDLLLTNGTDYLLLEDNTNLLRLVNSHYTVSITESGIHVTDSITVKHIFVRVIQESLARLQLVAGGLLLLTNGIDHLLLNSSATTTITDSLTARQFLKRTVTESAIPITESLSAFRQFMRTISEGGKSITDSLSRMVFFKRVIIEGEQRLKLIAGGLLLLTDGISYLRLENDLTIPVTDSITRVEKNIRTMTESNIPTTDSISAHRFFDRFITEGGKTITDSISRTIKAFRTITESNIPTTDNITKRIIYARAIVESHIPVTDSISRMVKFFRHVVESAITITDSIARAVLRSRGIRADIDFRNPKATFDIDFTNPKATHYIDFSIQ